MGTSQSEPCNQLGKEIWEWCICRNIWISAGHIPRVQNTTTISTTEWMIDRTLLTRALAKINFHPVINLFASRLNAQFPRYVAFKPNPGAAAIDALAWYPKTMQMCISPPIKLGPGKNLLRLPGKTNERHPLNKSLTLLVYLLLGNSSPV